MNTNGTDPELNGLISDLIDGSLDSTSRDQLNAMLRDNEAARKVYLEHCETHAALNWEHGLIVESNPVAVSDDRLSAGWRRIAVVASAVAASLAVAFLFWQTDVEQPEVAKSIQPDGPVIAQVVQRIGAVITSDSQPWDGDQLKPNQYELQQGLIHLASISGADLLIEAPASFEAKDDSGIVLHHGRLSATVPPEASGFRVETPSANIVDFGTEFSIDVDDDHSEIHVFDGHVQVQPFATTRGNQPAEASDVIDLRTSQAVRINRRTKRASGIDLDTNRFIRSFDEPQLTYSQTVKRLKPVAYYRMPIRKRGLHCVPQDHSGTVLTGPGRRPANAPGIAGSSLRVGGQSIGRGARVNHPAPLDTGLTSIAVWVYAGGRPIDATIASYQTENLQRLSLSLNDRGHLEAVVRDSAGNRVACTEDRLLPLQSWQHVVVTLGDGELQIYRNGVFVASVACSDLAQSSGETFWIGTSPTLDREWEGRIDELALFDRTLSAKEITQLYQAAPK